ncbi:MAG: hypothetical protein WBS22_06570 [Methylocystis sp.]
MAIKFLREIVVSSLATALVTAVYTHGPYTHGPDLKAIEAQPTVSPATTASLDGEDQRPQDLAQFMARVASGHVGKSSPRSPIAEAPASGARSDDSEPVWPPQLKSGAAKPARGVASAKPGAAKPAASTPDTASVTETKPAPEPVFEMPPAQAEAAPPASYATRIADKFKDYVWNPGASVVNGVSSGVSSVTNKITSFVKRQPS